MVGNIQIVSFFLSVSKKVIKDNSSWHALSTEWSARTDEHDPYKKNKSYVENYWSTQLFLGRGDQNHILCG